METLQKYTNFIPLYSTYIPLSRGAGEGSKGEGAVVSLQLSLQNANFSLQLSLQNANFSLQS